LTLPQKSSKASLRTREKTLEKSSAIWFFLACLVNVIFSAVIMDVKITMSKVVLIYLKLFL
jgi:hypothetical protein